MKLLDRNVIHSHTFKKLAGENDRCSTCNRQFAPGETIRRRRSNVDIDGKLLCWNSVRCEKNLPQNSPSFL